MSLRGLIVAIQFLTRLPTPQLSESEPGELTRASDWFPVAGALIGVVVAAAAWAGAHFGPWIGALFGLLAWVLVTGALHLDGLGDVADGLGGAHRVPGRFLEIVHDPHIGGFGVTAIGLQLLSKLVLLDAIVAASQVPALVLVAAWARWGTLVLGKVVPPLGEGLGQRFAEGIDWRVVGLHGAVLVAASVMMAPPLLGALIIVPMLAVYWMRRVGGITGDCHGASIEVTETLLLVLLVTLAR
jgi:adenosylcobinamide-GDP ribazoletransferase